ncbi:MAG: hypothetical protein R3C19_27275 [Planctomycetaceae bacterium]
MTDAKRQPSGKRQGAGKRNPANKVVRQPDAPSDERPDELPDELPVAKPKAKRTRKAAPAEQAAPPQLANELWKEIVTRKPLMIGLAIAVFLFLQWGGSGRRRPSSGGYPGPGTVIVTTPRPPEYPVPTTNRTSPDDQTRTDSGGGGAGSPFEDATHTNEGYGRIRVVDSTFHAGTYEGHSQYKDWYRHPLRLEVGPADLGGRFTVWFQSLDEPKYRVPFSGLIFAGKAHPIRLQKKESGLVDISDRDGPRWCLNQNLTTQDNVYLRCENGRLTGYANNDETFDLVYRGVSVPAPRPTQPARPAAESSAQQSPLQPATQRDKANNAGGSSGTATSDATANTDNRKSSSSDQANRDVTPANGWGLLQQGREGSMTARSTADVTLPIRITVLEVRPEANYLRLLIAHAETPARFVIYDSVGQQTDPQGEFKPQFRSGGRSSRIATTRRFSRESFTTGPRYDVRTAVRH